MQQTSSLSDTRAVECIAILQHIVAFAGKDDVSLKNMSCVTSVWSETVEVYTASFAMRRWEPEVAARCLSRAVTGDVDWLFGAALDIMQVARDPKKNSLRRDNDKKSGGQRRNGSRREVTLLLEYDDDEDGLAPQTAAAAADSKKEETEEDYPCGIEEDDEEDRHSKKLGDVSKKWFCSVDAYQSGLPLLHHACLCGSLRTARMMITSGLFDINEMYRARAVPMKGDSLKKLQSDRPAPGDDDSSNNSSKKTPTIMSWFTPLMIAAANGHAGICSLLLKNPQCKPNKQDRNGNTALHLAASHRHGDVVRALATESDAVDLLALNKTQTSALMLACTAGPGAEHEEMVKTLVGKKVYDLTASNTLGVSPRAALRMSGMDVKLLAYHEKEEEKS